MDNTSVNPTFMTHLQLALEIHGHPDFDATHNFVRCFSHIINLCSQAVIKKMEDDDAQGEHPETDTEPATATDDAEEDEDAVLLAPRTTRHTRKTGPIYRARRMVGFIRKSGQRRDQLLNTIKQGNDQQLWTETVERDGRTEQVVVPLKPLMVLPDVKT
jgi:hypothetical protein